MNDLISRRAAIEALKEHEDYKGYLHGDFETILENLPSERLEIIRCEDCKYQRKGQNECETWNLCGYRPWQYAPITDEHFCSHAERKDNG